MTNREVFIKSLQDSDVDEYTVDYIACPYVNNPDCKYDGSNNEYCCECKMKWLNKEWEQ